MKRILSGMRPTGSLHIGHLCGVLNNWKKLQKSNECYFFVADWHALTTDYAAPKNLKTLSHEIVLSWLSVGIDPKKAVLFVQSDVPEHAELHLLLSMICPLSWLMQLPTYKEQKENLQKNVDTYGFLGYPLLQSADIMAYRADTVPVGEDQLPHVEFTREVARRFNRFYGQSDCYKKNLKITLKKLSQDLQDDIVTATRNYREHGKQEALINVLEAINKLSLTAEEISILRGHCLFDAQEILVAPDSLLTRTPRLLGLDGRKMSKSYDNTIELFDTPPTIQKKVARMQTDPARQKRDDKGTPEKCPVWSLHQEFSSAEEHQWIQQGCTTASIGCVDCKKKLTQNINTVLEPLTEKRQEFAKEGIVEDILHQGAINARIEAQITLGNVRDAMKIKN